MREFSMNGMRAIESPIENVQNGVSPLITDLVLGQPQATFFPGSKILRPITAPNFVFQYSTWGTERLERYETERAMRAPIKHGSFKVDQVPAKLKRFSFGTLRDLDEISNAHPSLSLTEKCTAFSKTIVDMDIERRKRDLLLATGSYAAGNTLAIAGGSEWDTAGGDSKSNIQTVAKAICRKTGLQMEQLSVFLSWEALTAAKLDPIFIASRMNYDASTPTLAALQEYWGVGPVWSANPIEIDENGDLVPMYGDVAIIYYPGNAPDYDTNWGDLTFGVDFKWNKGVASTPFILPQHTSYFFPWTDYANPAIINGNAGGLITNCSSGA